MCVCVCDTKVIVAMLLGIILLRPLLLILTNDPLDVFYPINYIAIMKTMTLG